MVRKLCGPKEVEPSWYRVDGTHQQLHACNEIKLVCLCIILHISFVPLMDIFQKTILTKQQIVNLVSKLLDRFGKAFVYTLFPINTKRLMEGS